MGISQGLRVFHRNKTALLSSVSAHPLMARPRRIQEPVKLNLLIEKNHKDLAMELAAHRRMSVSRLFVSWLLRDLDGESSPEERPLESLARL